MTEGIGERRLGGFRFVREIRTGAGSQGSVFEAVCEDASQGIVPVGTVVALKVMPVSGDTDRLYRRLEQRTAQLAGIAHPNIVKYYGCFRDTGGFGEHHVIVQEFLRGETLKERLAGKKYGIDVDVALHVARSAARALGYAAGMGIVHRDVKPANIFLCDGGGVKIIDFEIAKQEDGTASTVEGNLRGSFDYMAPDFQDPDFRGDERSDIFSLGVAFHEMLTGRTPYATHSGSTAQFGFFARWADRSKDPIDISRRVVSLLSGADVVLKKALSASRDGRYSGFVEFAEGIGRIRMRHFDGNGSRWLILQYVGKGGFGEVFKGRDCNTKRLVAIKRLLESAYGDRFRREAKTMRALGGGCFVRFVDFVDAGDVAGLKVPFLVMDFLPGMPGSSLRDAIRRKGGGLDAETVLRAFLRYAKGLETMHREGIIHRDIKPSNLYFPELEPQSAVIMDFGIVRVVDGSVTGGQVPGTLDYMPPETIYKTNRGDGRMDIFALGLCLFEALTGRMAYKRLPQKAEGFKAFFERASRKEAPDFSKAGGLSAVPGVLELVRGMTDPEWQTRIADAGEVASRLCEIIELKFGSVEEPEAPTRHIERPELSLTRPSLGEIETPTQHLDNPVPPDDGGWEETVPFVLNGDSDNEADLSDSDSDPTTNPASVWRVVLLAVAGLVVLALAAAGLWYWRFRPASEFIAEPAESPVNLPLPPPEQEPKPPAANPEPGVEDMRQERSGEERRRREEEEKKRLEEEKKRLAREAEFAQLREKFESECRKAMGNEPVEDRYDRLKRVRAKVRKQMDTDDDGIYAPLKDTLMKDIDSLLKLEVGKIANKCPFDIYVAGRKIASGETALFELKEIPDDWTCRAEGYAPLKLDPEFEGKVMEIKPGTLSPLPVPLEAPERGVGVECFVNGGPVPREVVPGRLKWEYRRDDFETQTGTVEVQPGVAAALPAPGAWRSTAGLSSLVMAEAALRAGKWREAESALAAADVFGKANVERRRKAFAEVSRLKEEARLEEERKRREEELKRREEEKKRREAEEKKRREEELKRLEEERKRREADERRRREEAEKRREVARAELKAKCVGLLAMKPLASRKARAGEAQAVLSSAVAADAATYKSLEEELGAKIRETMMKSAGSIENATGLEIEAGGRKIAPGTVEIFEFADGILPEDWTWKAAGYETAALPRDFDGREVRISRGDLVPKEVPLEVSLPAGVTCRIDGKPFASSGKIRPGRHEAVFSRSGCLDVKVGFKVAIGKACTLASPAESEWIARYAEALAEAMDYGRNEIHYKACEAFHKAAALGWEPRGEEAEVARASFAAAESELVKIKERAEKDLGLKRRLFRDLAEIEQALADLLAWRNEMFGRAEGASPGGG